ncbi:MAG TPA: sulfate adenylyltransferase [Vicinamibacterales bacterium]|nr:sulfate adenylyltransferase [Vicinamibacterales bacterium]
MSDLVSRLATSREAAELQALAVRRPGVRLSRRAAADLELIAVGAYSPLEGFLTSSDYRAVVADLRLADGRPWPLPITLPITADEAARTARIDDVPLLDPEDGRPLGMLHVEERFVRDRAVEARAIYGTDDPAHPGVAALMAESDLLLGGRVTLLARRPPRFPAYARDPADTRALFRERGWRTIAGFQTRNPVHRAHEYIQKCALEFTDGLLLHPIVGETKADDVPAEIRMRCYEVLLAGYYPPGRVVLAVLPAAMRYAGPREAVFHALVRRNYGCTHFLVGRDHAGVGGYYDPYAAHRIFDRFAPGELGITPLFFEEAFHCRRCGGMASARTCPHGPDARVTLSGAAVRALVRSGASLPPEYTRPEVAALLAAALGPAGGRSEGAEPQAESPRADASVDALAPEHAGGHRHDRSA